MFNTSACALPQDLPGALSDAEVAEGLGLPQIKNRDWSIFKTSAVKGDGLFEGELHQRSSDPTSAGSDVCTVLAEALAGLTASCGACCC
jgi:ADP-ribosylation factor family